MTNTPRSFLTRSVEPRLAVVLHGQTAGHWRSLARAVGFSAEGMIDRIREPAARIPDAIARVLAHPSGDRGVWALLEHLLTFFARNGRASVKRPG